MTFDAVVLQQRLDFRRTALASLRARLVNRRQDADAEQQLDPGNKDNQLASDRSTHGA
jgi:hypothetical protein